MKERNNRKKYYFIISFSVAGALTGYCSWLVATSYVYTFKSPSTYDGETTEVGPVAYIVGSDTKYTSIEKALSIATSGNIVSIIPPTDANYHNVNNKVIPNKVTYTIRRDCEIKAGVTLAIPTDVASFSSVTDASTLSTYITSMKEDDGSRGSIATSASYAKSSSNNYLRATVKIANNVTLTNNGSLLVSGYLGGGNSGAGSIGQTAQSYTQIILGENAKIVQNNSSAVTYCFGYISELVKNNGSSVIFNYGSLYIPMIIHDYRGFAFSWAMTVDAIDTHRSSPFNQLDFVNIDSLVSVKYNAKVYGNANFYVSYSTLSVDQHFNKTIDLVGNTSSSFIQLNNSSYSSLNYKYDVSTQISKIDLIGGNAVNPFALTLSASIITVNLSTTNTLFPISYRFNVDLSLADGQTSATFDSTSQRLKILPGATFVVNEGCTLNVGDLIIYSAFYDGTLGNGASSVNMYSGVSYPLKDGATFKVLGTGQVVATNLAGTIYCDTATNITQTTDAMTSKEAWSYKSSGSVNPAWKTSEFLEIKERLNVVATTNIDKLKLFAGLNTFTNYNSFLPYYQILANDETITENIDTYQRVLFFDSITNYKLDFVSNVYKAYSGKTYYDKNSVITYGTATKTLNSINSTMSISNNNGGVNEFDAQSITIECTTPLVDDQIPLYIGKSINLSATVVDIDKAYNKTLTWTSLNEGIATVNDGVVTGVALGTTTIQAELDGVIGSFDVTVIEEQTIVAIESIAITDNSGNSTATSLGTFSNSHVYNGKYGNNKTVVFTVQINPSNAPYSSIEWTFTASAQGRQYINDSSVATETISNVTSVTMHTTSGTGTSDDEASLKCVITDLGGSSFTVTFGINHQADTSVCVLPDTMLTMADGTYKRAADIRYGDIVMAVNHDSGCIEPTIIIANDHVNQKAEYHHIMTLSFSDGSNTRIAYEHGFFDVEVNKYIYINEKNYKKYIGHRFYGVKSANDMNKKVIKLVNVAITNEFTQIYSPITKKFLDIITDDMISIAGALSGLFNFFDYDKDTLKYNKESMERDIEKYGVFTYKDFEHLFSKEIYDILPCEYLKVAIGKGLITWKMINEYVMKFGPQLVENTTSK